MSDGPTEKGSASALALVDSMRSQLEPLLIGVIDSLADDSGTGSFFAAGAFVQDLLERLRSVTEESELLRLFLDISLINFQDFEFSAAGKRAIDTLLVECESIAKTLTTANPPH
jgi:hypothetical protein